MINLSRRSLIAASGLAAAGAAGQDETLAEAAPVIRWRIERGRLSQLDDAAPEEAEAFE